MIVVPHLSLDFSSFATRRSGVRIPSRPPNFSPMSQAAHNNLDGLSEFYELPKLPNFRGSGQLET